MDSVSQDAMKRPVRGPIPPAEEAIRGAIQPK
jgi:hypothetical protein